MSGIGTVLLLADVGSASEKPPQNIMWKTGLPITNIILWALITCTDENEKKKFF